MADCIFCSIVAGAAPASLLHESEHVIAFMDINPVTPGHLLVIPRRHWADLSDVPAEIAAELMTVGQSLAMALRRTDLTVDGINLFYADGEAAGQEVFHSHLHVIPRRPGDGFEITPSRGRAPTRETLDGQAAAIKTGVIPFP